MSITIEKCQSNLDTYKTETYNIGNIIMGLILGSGVIFGMSIVASMMSRSYVSFTSVSLSIIFLALAGTAVYLFIDTRSSVNKANEEYNKCVKDVNTAVEALAKAKADKEAADALADNKPPAGP